MEHRNEPQSVALHRGRELTRWMALLASFLLVSLLVVTGSRAAFTDTTDNTGNQFAAGTVVLTDDDGGSAMFDVANMAPGDSVSHCIEVEYGGTIDPSQVKVYSGGYSGSAALAQSLNLTIEEGDGAVFDADCTNFTNANQVFSGTLEAFSGLTDYASGVGTWDPASSGDVKSYRFTVQLDSDPDNTAQGTSVTDVAFVWEVST